MNYLMKDLLLVQSLSLGSLTEQYHEFFLALLPSIFIVALIVEFFDRLNPFGLMRRVLISILLLTTVSSFYTQTIDASMATADEILQGQKQENILLMDMFGGFNHWKEYQGKEKESFFKDNSKLEGALKFIKYHLFDSFINDGFTITIYFIAKLCFLILKVVYSLVYYLGLGLIGIPCLLYIFPTMGNVLRGAIFSYLWCLIVPHILVFIISLIGSEINQGYTSGQIIGGSMMGTTLLFILTLFIAFTPLIASMILAGSGLAQAGGIIASIGANYVMNLPRNSINTSAALLSGGTLGPKMKLASKTLGTGYKFAKNSKSYLNKNLNSEQPDKEATSKDKYNSNSKFNLSSNTSINRKNNPQFKSDYLANKNKLDHKGVRNGAVYKHDNSNKEYKKATNNHRDHKLFSKSRNSNLRKSTIRQPKQ